MATRISKITRNKRAAGNVLRPDQVRPYLDKELQELALLIKEFIINTAQTGGKHAFRKDGKSGFVQSTEVTFNSDGVEITMPEHAQYIERGRKPGTKRVPIGALVGWLKRYRIIGRDAKTGKYVRSSDKSIISTAFAIQSAIFKNGINPRSFIRESLDFSTELLSQAIEEIMIPEIISIINFTPKKK